MVNRFSTMALACLLLASTLTTPALAKTKIAVYHRNELREIEWMKQVEVQFEALNPDIDVELIEGIGGGGAPYAERLAVLWASGSPPDVFYGSADKAGFILNGWAYDVTALLKRDSNEINIGDYFAGVFDASTRQGRNMGVPAVAMSQALFYNKDLFMEAGLALPPIDWDSSGWNWDDFLLAAQKLTRFGPDGKTTQVGINTLNDRDFTWLNGGDWFPKEAYETGVTKRVTLTTSANIQAYTRLYELYVQKRYSSGSPNSGVSSSGFVAQRMGMEWTGWYKVRDYFAAKQAGTMKFNWGIAAIPKIANRANTRYSDPWFISSRTTHLEESWRFVKFVTSQQGQTSFAQYVAYPPSRQSALLPYLETIMDASGMNRKEALTALSGALNHSRPGMDEVVGGMSVMRPLIDPEVKLIFTGQKSILEALQTAEQKVNAMLPELAARWSK